MIADFDARSLQPRQVAAWSSTPMNGLVSILFTPAAASTLSIANAWLSWKFALIYSQDVNSKVSWSGTVYSDNGESGSDLSLCVGDYTPASTGTTEGIPWTEGTVDFDGTWRSLATGNMVTMIFSLSCRFYQTAAPGLAIASAASEIVKGPTGFQVNQATQWQCTLQPPGTVTPITIVGSVVENWC
jgi:hypothetical protein